MNPDELKELKFHWDKWKGESKAFWLRTALGSAILLISIAFQFGIVRISINNWVNITPPKDPRRFYIWVNILSWFLLAFLAFKFIDLMRHRVPDGFEKAVHNNKILGINLLWFGRIAYLVFPLYFSFLGYTLYLAFVIS